MQNSYLDSPSLTVSDECLNFLKDVLESDVKELETTTKDSQSFSRKGSSDSSHFLLRISSKYRSGGFFVLLREERFKEGKTGEIRIMSSTKEELISGLRSLIVSSSSR